MALPSSLFSFAARFLSLRQANGLRLLHSGKVNYATAKEDVKDEQSSGSPGGVDFMDAESTVIPDIIVEDTLQEKDYFGVKKLCSSQLLFKHKVHYGHKATSLEPGMRQFVFGIRSDQVIFDLDITNFHMQEALNVTAHMALRDAVILFVARLPHCNHLIERTAKDCGEFAHTRLWREGTLTDINNIQRMECRLPDLLIFPSIKSELGTEHLAVKEASKLGIPTVAIVDSNCNPNLVTYPVPGNDDTPSAIELYCSLFKEAIMRGKNERARRMELLKEQMSTEVRRRQNVSQHLQSNPTNLE